MSPRIGLARPPPKPLVVIKRFGVAASWIVTIGERPGIRTTEADPALSGVSRPREAEKLERLSSANTFNISPNSAD